MLNPHNVLGKILGGNKSMNMRMPSMSINRDFGSKNMYGRVKNDMSNWKRVPDTKYQYENGEEFEYTHENLSRGLVGSIMIGDYDNFRWLAVVSALPDQNTVDELPIRKTKAEAKKDLIQLMKKYN